jgi:type I restriction enzyme S subunit
MRQGWEIKKLGEVLEYEKIQNTHIGLPYVGLEHIESHTGRFIGSSQPQKVKSSTFLFSDKHVLYGRLRPYLNKVLIPYFDGHCSTEIFPIKVKKGLSREFLFYWLTSDSTVKKIDATWTGARMPRANMNKVLSFEITLPPPLEQQRIVSILDECFAAINKAKANAKQNLKNAKELFESYLQSVFEKGNENWEIQSLDELGTITSSKRIYKSEYVKCGVPFYRTKEIKELSNSKSITLELFISRERYEGIKQTFGTPKIGDLLMTAVGTIGEIMVIENEDEFYFKDGNILWFKDFERLDTNYLKYALTAFVEKIKSLAIGAAYSALTIEKLNKYEIAFPKTKTEQQTIIRQLDALQVETQKLEAVYQKKIDDLEELKKSILQKAFAGELEIEKGVAV